MGNIETWMVGWMGIQVTGLLLLVYGCGSSNGNGVGEGRGRGEKKGGVMCFVTSRGLLQTVCSFLPSFYLELSA